MITQNPDDPLANIVTPPESQEPGAPVTVPEYGSEADWMGTAIPWIAGILIGLVVGFMIRSMWKKK